MNEYKENDIVEGIVTSIKKYGVFLSFENNYVGLLHISEVSTKFITNIYNYFKIGDKVKVLIKTIDKETKYLTVSIKSLPPSMNPYKSIDASKKLTNYVKDIDFSKLDKALPRMIEDELKRESEENKND